MGKLKKLAGQTAIYGLSSIIGRALNYLLVPIHTEIFDKAGDYGVVTELYAYVAFLNVIYLFGLETAFFRFATKDPSKGTSYFNQIQTAIFLIAILISGILYAFSDQMANSLDYSGQERFIEWFAAIMFIDAIVAIPFARLRLAGRAKRFAITKLINIALNIGLNILFYWELIWPDSPIHNLYDPSIGVGYVFLANLIANAAFLLLLGDQLVKFRPALVMAEIKSIIKYAIPLVFTGLAAVTNEMLSRAILKHRLPDNFYEGLTNIDALGVFGACYKLSVFMTLSIQAFKYAAEPFFFSNAADKGSPKLFAQVMDGYIIFACFLLFSVTINLDIFGLVFLRNEVYREALGVVPYLLLGGLFLGIYYNLSVWYKLTDQTKWAAYIAGFGAVITFVLNWVLIPVLGYMGSAYVTVISYFIMVLLSYSIGQKKYPIPYKTLKGMSYILISFFAALFLYEYHPFGGLIEQLLLNIALMVLFAFIVFKIENISIKKLFRQ